MNKASEDYEMAMSVGYGCGICTVDGAFCQVARNYDAFFLIEESVERLNNLSSYITKLGTWEKTIQEAMGQRWCDQRDAEEIAFWESQQ